MKENKNQLKSKTVRLLVILLSTVLLLSACGSRDPLVGNWIEPNSGVVMEINQDGEVSMTLNGASITLNYETEDPDVFILLGSEDGSIPEQRMTYRIKEERLILTLDGVNTVFFRDD